MYKSGLLPAPVIQPLKYDLTGSKIKIGPNTFIQIKTDVPGARVYFTVDGTKPDPFQKGRTGKASTHKYIGPFRLQLGNRVVRAIVASRDRLRESPVATKYIDVILDKSDSDHENIIDESSSSSDEEPNNKFLKPESNRNKFKPPFNENQGEVYGSVEGPINPVNYTGTQINVWGFPTPDLAAFLSNKNKKQEPNLGYLTDQMIKNLNTPRAIEAKPQNEPPENLKKFFKQIQKLYERDNDFQTDLDNIIENAQIKSANVAEKHDSFNILFNCPKFIVSEPPKPKPKPREKSPEIEIKIAPLPPEPTPPPKIDIPKPPPKIEIPKPPPQIETPKPKPIIKKDEPIKVPEKKPIEPSVYIEELQFQGTMVDASNFNPERDAEHLRKAVKGLGTNESMIIEIMGNRSVSQRLKIKNTYKAMYGRDLVEDLKGDTSGNFQKVLVALLMDPVEFDCVEIRKAIQGLGTDNSTLIEILTSRSNKRLKDVSQLYQQLYKKKMEDDIMSDTSGSFKKLLYSLLAANRPEKNEVDMNLVHEDVEELIKAGVKKWGTDESKFNSIFGTRSYAHLRKLFEEYQKKNGKSIEDTIKSEFSGNISKAYLALISNIRSRPGFFAQQIKKAIKGAGTDEHTLNRVIVSRCEIDTKQIKEEYTKLFGKNMEQDILGDVSGDYGKLLAELLKDPAHRVFEGASEPEIPHEIIEVPEPVIEETPTLKPVENFNPASDCEKLKKAMKGLGTDEEAIIQVIGYRSSDQRQELKRSYQQMYGKDLIKELKSETSGDFKHILEALMLSKSEFDAFSFRKAVEGLGTDDSALIELLTTRSNEQLQEAKQTYQRMFNRDLEKDIKSDTSGHFQKGLISLLTASRPNSNGKIDITQAKMDSQSLINAGAKKWGTDESIFITIFCTRSYGQLRAMFEEYKNLAGHPIEEDINKELSGNFKKSLLSIVKCVRDKQEHFATLLHKSMKGLGTADTDLIRIVVSRCEVDMVQIKQKFQAIAKSSLEDFIKGDTSSDYRKVLLALIGGEPNFKKSKSSSKSDDPIIQQAEPEGPHEIVEVPEPVIEQTPTLKPVENFNPASDCEKLKKAMKGLGTDEKAIIEVLANRSNEQRQEIKKSYQQMYGKDLIKELDSETSGNFRSTLDGLMLSKSEFDAFSFRKAVEGLGTDDSALVELLTTRSNEQLQEAKQTYQRMFNRDLEKDIKSDTSGDFQKMLVSLVTASRPTGTTVDKTLAKIDSQSLINAGAKKWGTDESIFITIFCTRSYGQLRAMFEEYKNATGHSIEDDIKKEMSGNLSKCLLAIVACVVDKQMHFAALLHKSMDGAGTDDSRLIRIVVSRCEVDMVQIKQKFTLVYKSSLADFIKGDTSGDYRRILLKLIGEN